MYSRLGNSTVETAQIQTVAKKVAFWTIPFEDVITGAGRTSRFQVPATQVPATQLPNMPAREPFKKPTRKLLKKLNDANERDARCRGKKPKSLEDRIPNLLEVS